MTSAPLTENNNVVFVQRKRFLKLVLPLLSGGSWAGKTSIMVPFSYLNFFDVPFGIIGTPLNTTNLINDNFGPAGYSAEMSRSDVEHLLNSQSKAYL